MTKQEYMAMSLPYGLKIIHDDNEVATISALGDSFQYQISGRSITYGWYGETFDCTPILRPLSDLTKPIKHKGEKFVPIVRLMEIAFGVEIDLSRAELSFMNGMYIAKINGLEFAFDITDNSLNLPSYVPKQLELFQQLLKWHFDLFGGIESGEAIDVNTLDINPYK